LPGERPDRAGCSLKDVETRLKTLSIRAATPVLAVVAFVAILFFPECIPAQTKASAGPPTSSGFYPLSEVHRGLKGTAWTVFTGSEPEAMDVEILGVLRGARGPGHDMILAQLHGTKPEYTGVVAGMSGSPVYIGDRLLGSLSYRIGQFSKDPIAGITPIEQMLEVRDLPVENLAVPPGAVDPPAALSELLDQEPGRSGQFQQAVIQAMETPLVMSGFSPGAIQLWQKRMTGTGLDIVAAGGMGGSSDSSSEPSAKAIAGIVPGSAVSAQLVRGDLEIAATCTVTYVDPKQLLACGHPILQAGAVSLPMTATEVVTTLASPLNAFKIVNTGATIGAFTDDRDSAIRGLFGAKARMIPLHIRVHEGDKERRLNAEILDMTPLTPQAVTVVLYQALVQDNNSSLETSYHLTGNVELDGYPPSPLDLWTAGGEGLGAALEMAVRTGDQFSRLFSSGSRQGMVRAVTLDVTAIPNRVGVELVSAKIESSDMVHAGDTVVVEATIRPWRQPTRDVRIRVKLPARLQSGNLRLLVSDAGTLDRTLDQPRMQSHPPNLETTLALARRQHPADRLYVSLLMPETQAGMEGQTLTGLPLSMANALEPLRTAQEATLNGESAVVAGEAPAGGLLSGFALLNLRVEAGGGLN